MENSPSPAREDKLTAAVRALTKAHLSDSDSLVIALSGGMDSASLLHAMLPLKKKYNLTACYVDHGISKRAPQWEKFCQELCARYKINFVVRRPADANETPTKIRATTRDMTEQQARRTRMRAFAGLSAAAVVAAHHADDQAETTLFRMLRGTGVHGMGAMRECAPLPGAAGMLILRPWLTIPRAEIADYARRNRLRWVEDEDNRNVLRRRNFLRHRAMPMLREYFPECGRTLSAASSRFAAAADLLSALAAEDEKKSGGNEDGFSLAYFRQVGAARLQNWLHIRLSNAGVRFGERGLAESARQILNCRGELAVPFDGITLRVWRDGLYSDSLPPPPDSFCIQINARRQRTELPQIGGVLVANSVGGDGVCVGKVGEELTARLRSGGERIFAGGRARSVSDVLRAANIPPWHRRRLPLLFANGGEIAAVPGVATAQNFRAAKGENGIQYKIEWQGGGIHCGR